MKLPVFILSLQNDIKSKCVKTLFRYIFFRVNTQGQDRLRKPSLFHNTVQWKSVTVRYCRILKCLWDH